MASAAMDNVHGHPSSTAASARWSRADVDAASNAVPHAADRPAWLPTEEEVLRWSAERHEPAALGAARLGGLAALRKTLHPERSSHLWRYADPERLWPASEAVPASYAATSPIRAPAPPEAGAVVVLAAAASPAIALSSEASEAGVQIVPMQGQDSNPEPFGTIVPLDAGPFEALNAAAWSTGVLVRVPRRARLSGAIRLVVPATARASMPRILVVLEDEAEATILEEHVGGGADRAVISVTELGLGAAARGRHVLVEGWESGTRAHLTARASLERDADLLTVLVGLGGSYVKADLGSHLDGQGAHSELAGLLLAAGAQHLDHHTAQRHHAPATTSNMDLRVVLSERARSAYTGLIRIEEGAIHSEAYQEERNLLLSPSCRADAIPELEILNQEVHCTHGATSAPVDSEQLFMLESRGIPRAQAEQMIVRGFFEPTLARLPEPQRSEVSGRLDRRLAKLWSRSTAARPEPSKGAAT